jgi:hypothetical protein
MSSTDLAQRPTESSALAERHPRGRGFGILSRLARVDDTAGRHVREDAHDEQTTVVAFDRHHPDPRHRRDDLVSRRVLHFG